MLQAFGKINNLRRFAPATKELRRTGTVNIDFRN